MLNHAGVNVKARIESDGKQNAKESEEEEKF